MVNFTVPPGIVGRPGAVKQLEKDARVMLRLVSPRVSATQDEKGVFANCQVCNPPPQVYECLLCGWATDQRWAYRMHITWPPKQCLKTMERTAQKWAERS